MPDNIKNIVKKILFPLISIKYRFEHKFFLADFAKRKYEFGRCSICGYYSRFWYNEIINGESKIAKSCGYDAEFIKVINITNSMHCRFCQSKFRVRAAAESLLNNINTKNYNSINKLVKDIKTKKLDRTILETASSNGIFSNYSGLQNLTKSEYLDDIKRGEYKNGIRSEDLQKLTLSDDSIDILISLDVFEHIPEPFQAFSEVRRVLKNNGFAIITVPIDKRLKKSYTLAKLVNGNINYLTKPAYHSDPLREEGALVFTEFGLDIIDKLKELGYNAILDEHNTINSRITQYVLVIKK